MSVTRTTRGGGCGAITRRSPGRDHARARPHARATHAREAERDEYRKLFLLPREENEKLRRGLLGQKAERLGPSDRQLSLSILEMLRDKKAEPEAPQTEPVRAHERRKPTGRKPLPVDYGDGPMCATR